MEINVGGSPHAQFARMAAPATRAHIVVVEDDASLLEALAFALRAAGYEVSAYRTATRALDDHRLCDCLIVDLKLPDVDGLTLVDRLRELGVAPPAILITTSPDAQCRRRAAKANVAIIEKPLLDRRLSIQVAAAVGRPTP